MSLDRYIALLEMLLATGLMFWLVYGLWPALLSRLAHEQLLAVRDELFFLAAEGKLGFDSNEYRQIWNTVNRTIKYCHNITWLRFLLFRRLLKPEHRLDALETLLEDIRDDEVKALLKKQVHTTLFIAGLVIWLRSPLLVLLSMPILPFVLMARLLQGPEALEMLRARIEGFAADIRAEITLLAPYMTVHY